MVLDMNAMLFCIQHTILGKMAYAPTVGRLACGKFPSDPRGFWQDDGYGILSVFKQDWDRFGGVYLVIETQKLYYIVILCIILLYCVLYCSLKNLL